MAIYDSSMPPPALPSQRKRSKMSGSVSSGVSSNGTSGAFTPSMKLEVKKLSDDKCWVCEARTVDIAHVISQEDNATRLLSEQGLLNFQPISLHNAIALCPSCHRAFDNALDPGLFFYPVDLEYFIRIEKENYQFRCQRGESGSKEPRTCPTRETYKQHQEAQELIPANACGGLYQCIILRDDYLPKFSRPICLSELNTTLAMKSWHGAPSAALRRAFAALGTLRVNVIPLEIQSKLRELQMLYTRTPSVAEIVSTGSRQVPRLIPQKRPHPDESPFDNNRSDPQIGPASHGTSQATHRAHLQHTAGHSSSNTWVSVLQNEWTLGPDSSSSDAIRKYRHLFESQETKVAT